ncbi:Nif3-like dinuclear metal center hexameric protein [Rugosimonospora acidiphila]|uniref:GTP cyclohydrolase 1 type 2 homolog n=1 Tax=Rugosimonospora acidiphila TaxID=556531 RepID=A0ABP9RQ92_9ACTN
MTSVGEVVAYFNERYPPGWAEDWDRVGLVVGEPDAPVRRALFVVDCVPETVEEAVAAGADLIVAHHPLLLRGVSSVAATTYKGKIIHRLIKSGTALFVAHTNADVAAPGVSDALAGLLGLTDTRPLRPAEGAAAGGGRGTGRIGSLPAARSLFELTALAARVLPATAWGVRAAGDPDRMVRTVAVCGGAGDTFLADAGAGGADAYLTADLRHHPASEHLAAGGPALLDAAHWATERPWLDRAAADLTGATGIPAMASDLVTDPWTVRVASGEPPATAPNHL